MSSSFDATQRNALQQAAARGDPLQCPVCDVALSHQEVSPSPQVAYVRHRLWLLCPHCRRTASIDLPPRRRYP
jgi:hypothetical protein